MIQSQVGTYLYSYEETIENVRIPSASETNQVSGVDWKPLKRQNANKKSHNKQTLVFISPLFFIFQQLNNCVIQKCITVITYSSLLPFDQSANSRKFKWRSCGLDSYYNIAYGWNEKQDQFFVPEIYAYDLNCSNIF